MPRRLIYGSIALSLFLTPLLATAQEGNADLAKEVAELRALVQKLQNRVNALENASTSGNSPAPAPSPAPTPAAVVAQVPAPSVSTPASGGTLAGTLLNGTSINLMLDGYYGYNFNRPIGRVNLLRPYDVSSNAFSLNQAALVVENAPDLANNKRWGVRADFQYGQATESLGGNAANELRPDVYRAIYQAYGTYVIPIGSGLTVDFGKWASSLGIEGTYTKDQINYSRSLLFTALPFYHMGARMNYRFNDKLAASYWITNGTQQTEPFKGFKDQSVGLAIQPIKAVSWNINYYFGQEHPDVIFYPNGNAPAGLPTQQGTPFQPIPGAPSGKLHIFDTYATIQLSPKLTAVVEADYLIQRLKTTSAPAVVVGGAGYLKYQFNNRFSLAGRAEYVSDRNGMFSGAGQALKETTLTATYKINDNFMIMQEWRRDFSNHPYFLTDTLGILKKEQNTATLGLLWWFGPKQGSW